MAHHSSNPTTDRLFVFLFLFFIFLCTVVHPLAHDGAPFSAPRCPLFPQTVHCQPPNRFVSVDIYLPTPMTSSTACISNPHALGLPIDANFMGSTPHQDFASQFPV